VEHNFEIVDARVGITEVFETQQSEIMPTMDGMGGQ
jgi:hypothetical protein